MLAERKVLDGTTMAHGGAFAGAGRLGFSEIFRG